MNLPFIEALDLRPAKPIESEMIWDWPVFPRRVDFFIVTGHDRLPWQQVSRWSYGLSADYYFEPRRVSWPWVFYFVVVLALLAFDAWWNLWR